VKRASRAEGETKELLVNRVPGIGSLETVLRGY